MIVATVEFVADYIEKINKASGLSMKFKYKIEETLRPIRISLYDEPEYASFFSVGDEVRVSRCSRYRVVDVKKEKGNVFITAEPIVYKAKFSKEPKTFEKAELFEMYTHHEDYSNFSFDLRKNLIILSAHSVTEKNTIYNALKLRMPEIEKAITATTRNPRAGEVNTVDYYFYSKEEFNEKKKACAFVEYNEYDNNYYGTPYSEIERYSSSTPLFLIVDRHGMMSIMCKYPLSTSVFLAPPSMEELEKQIRECGDNTPEEIKRRIEQAKREIQHSDWYDYVVKNIDVKECVDKIEAVLRKRLNESGIIFA